MLVYYLLLNATNAFRIRICSWFTDFLKRGSLLPLKCMRKGLLTTGTDEVLYGIHKNVLLYDSNLTVYLKRMITYIWETLQEKEKYNVTCNFALYWTVQYWWYEIILSLEWWLFQDPPKETYIYTHVWCRPMHVGLKNSAMDWHILKELNIT